MASTDLTPRIDRLRLPVLIQVYDRAMLERWSRDWFDRLDTEVGALPQDAHPDLLQDPYNRLVQAYSALSLAHLGDALARVRSAEGLDEDVRYWAGEFICTFIEPKSEAAISKMIEEGIDPSTGRPMAPGWLMLERVDEVYEAWSADLQAEIASRRKPTTVVPFRRPPER